MTLHIKAKPGSKGNQIIIADDGTITIKIKAPAQDGKANEELVRFLAEKLGLSKSKINIVSGFSSPFKKLEIEADEGAVREKLASF
jgi:uncharacterized protein (TIGR00251 family)